MFLPKVIFRTLVVAMLVLAAHSVIIEPDEGVSLHQSQLASSR